MCTWTDPPVQDLTCEYMWPTNPICLNPGATCAWTVDEGPGENATCAPCAPGCTTSTYCVRLKRKECREIFVPFVGLVCYCRDTTDLVIRGTRNICQ